MSTHLDRYMRELAEREPVPDRANAILAAASDRVRNAAQDPAYAAEMAAIRAQGAAAREAQGLGPQVTDPAALATAAEAYAAGRADRATVRQAARVLRPALEKRGEDKGAA